tara:strand:+ start:254 stop:2245 length:1992 start_codon:yes stop_codon:yes gene_type:complete
MMMNPTMNRIEQLDNFQDSIQSTEAIDRLRAMQGLRSMPTVQMEKGGSIADTAENLASYGRFGDSVLLHVRPDELQGLMSLGNITYNPITGLPEAFSLKSITKPFKNIVKSKAFKMIAPIAIGIAAPYLLGPAQLGLFSTYAGGMGAVNFGLASGIGGLVGGYAGGRRGSDLFKQAAIQGVTAGALKGLSNYGQQRALAKGLEADAAAKTTSGSSNLQAGTSNANVQGSAYVASTPENMALNAPGGVPSQTAYVDSTKTFGAPDNFSTYSNVPDAGSRQLAGLGSDIRPIAGPVAVEPNYMAQAKSILAADPTAGTTFNIGEGGISEAAAQEQLQASVNRPFTERLMDSAVSFNDKGGVNILGTAGKLASAAAPGELASTAIDMENAMEEAERAEEEAARAQLAQMDYEIDTGFGGQTVIRDPSGVVLPAYLSSQDILDIALGRKARPRLVPGTQFAATRDIVNAEEGTPGGLQSILDKAKMLFTRGYEDDEEDKEMSDVDEANEIETQEILNQYYKVVKEQPSEVETVYAPGTGARRLLEEALNLRGLPSPFTTNKLKGGLISMAQGGEFSGMVPGNGGGMDDNVYMPIKEGNEQVGTLAVSPTEYVVDSYTMAALGDGNPSEGAKVMDRTVKQIRQKAYGTMKQPNEINGLQALKPMMRRV